MSQAVEQIPVPIFEDSDGILRIGGTRVTLETIVSAFESGSTCEEIAQQYPAVGLSDVYLAIGYYLTYRNDLAPYLERRAAQEHQAETERPLAPSETNREIRERLLRRLPTR